MRSSPFAPWLCVSCLAFIGAGCEDEVVLQAPPTGGMPELAPSTTTSARRVAPTASATGKSRCEELNEALWEAVRDAPKACTSPKDCVIVGPGSCRAGGTTKSCVAGVAKGYEGPIDDISKRWEAAGCEKGLEEIRKERLVCKAGECTVLFKRNKEED